MGRKICILCTHYQTCKFVVTLREACKQLDVEWHNDKKFNQWRRNFARFCAYWELDKPSLEHMHESLDFIFHDFIIENPDLKSSSLTLQSEDEK